MQLSHDRWPSWLVVPHELRYQSKKQRLLDQYELFINRWPKSQRMPISLYYKAVLSEYSPDIGVLAQSEMLHFYSDYPSDRSRQTWYRLYGEFGDSPESLEARWRIAKHWAGQGKFEQANALASQAQAMVGERLKLLAKEQLRSDTFFSPFRPPANSIMAEFKLIELQRRLNQLRDLVSKENRTDKADAEERLARFVMLNPHGQQFAGQLDELLKQMDSNDPLRDNVLLAQAKLVSDEQMRAERLSQLYKEFRNTDGGMQALYELGLLKIQLWRQQSGASVEQKKKYLIQARAILTSFINEYPNSFCADQARKNLEDLPAVD